MPTRDVVFDNLVLNRLNQRLRPLAVRTLEDRKRRDGIVASARIRSIGQCGRLSQRATRNETADPTHAPRRLDGLRLPPGYRSRAPAPVAEGYRRSVGSRSETPFPVAAQANANGGVALHFFGANVAGIYCEAYDFIVVAPPPEAGSASRAARLQGACSAQIC